MQADQLLVILLLGNLLGMTGKGIRAISEIKQYLYEASNNTQQNLGKIFGSQPFACRQLFRTQYDFFLKNVPSPVLIYRQF